MHHRSVRLLPLLLIACLATTAPVTCAEGAAPSDEPGFERIFDGKSLDGWGVPVEGFWKVEDEAITGEVTKEHAPKENVFLTWRRGTVDDFVLRFRFRIFGAQANSGMQFRSEVKERGLVHGYQADMSGDGKFVGQLYDEYGPRTTLAGRGQRVRFDAEGKKTAEDIGDPFAGEGKTPDYTQWTDYEVAAEGEHVTLRVNGKVTAELFDADPRRRLSGVLAVPVITSPMKVQFKDLRLKRLKKAGASGAAGALKVTAPPPDVVEHLGLKPFYKKYVAAGPLAVVGSEKPRDEALLEAAFLIGKMTEHRPQLLDAMNRARVRFAVMAYNEFTTAIPEHSDLEPAAYWDRRARGLGASPERPAVSCGEENLLSYPGDPYAAENILIHEFGHAIHEMGMKALDPTFDKRLNETYEAAMADGLWKHTYAATNRMEYWAEGTQSYFDTNDSNNAEHNDISTREKLRKYDPRLAKLLAEVYGEEAWRYTRPNDRAAGERMHLAGYDPATAPHFVWPKELLEANKRLAAGKGEMQKLAAIRPGDNPPAASPPAGPETSVVFVNRTGDDLTLYWLDENGKRQRYAVVRAGATVEQSTYAGHVWLLARAGGEPVAYAVAAEKPGRVVVEK